jgi:hypothetical protein
MDLGLRDIANDLNVWFQSAERRRRNRRIVYEVEPELDGDET